jgi:lysozyme
MIHGIDVSKWQGTIDWKKVAAADVRYAFIKATEGIGYVDPMLHRNARGADAVGLKVGLYHFLRPDNTNPLVEAAHFVETIRALPYEWIVCDVEDSKGEEASRVIGYTLAWLLQVEKLTGKKPIVYTYVSFANQYLKDSLINWPLWIAHYNVEQPGETAWPKWICWQSTDKGTVDGITGHVDYNWMRPEFFEPPAAVKKTEFKDVEAGSWYEDVIWVANEHGIMTGYEDGTFRPDQPVTRAEVAAVVNALWFRIDSLKTT